MAAVLASFLQRMASEPFRYGEWDCALAVANWVREATGIDPAERLRGRYRTELGWKLVAGRAGGLPALFADIASRVGLSAVHDSPRPGDVGLVQVRSLGVFGAIRGEGRWVVKLNNGVVGADFPALAVWRLPEPA